MLKQFLYNKLKKKEVILRKQIKVIEAMTLGSERFKFSNYAYSDYIKKVGELAKVSFEIKKIQKETTI